MTPDGQAQLADKTDAGTLLQAEPRLDVSVVIPCLNEANSLAFCVEKAIVSLRQAGLRGEVIVADNGSTDGSIEIAEFNGARVLHVPERGYGAALKAGIAAARGEFVIMGDADDSYDFSEVPNFVKELRRGFDLVMGNRFRGGIKPGAMPPLHRYFGNPGLSWLVNFLFHAGVGDSYCGMRGFSRALYDKLDLRSSGMEFALEFVIKATQIGARISEIPIILWPDKRDRPPHLRSFRDGWRSLRFMLLYAPNWLYLVPGGSLLTCGLALIFWLLPGPRQITPRVTLDVHTMVFGVIFTLLGMQILSIGAFAKVFSYAARFDRGTISLKRLLKRITLETGLLIGGLIFFAGLIGCARITWGWVTGGFGPLYQIRQILFWSTWLFLGIQIIFSSFFLSMLGISRETYIGDYELK
ncbi:MAG TPA: glycosyltransferase family 2 protein [Candidatus Baltobacteraceae bacterium]|nr:glycosyltransferase family 2 protein [Candidatus Baltobacteraceae bacterium]